MLLKPQKVDLTKEKRFSLAVLLGLFSFIILYLLGIGIKSFMELWALSSYHGFRALDPFEVFKARFAIAVMAFMFGFSVFFETLLNLPNRQFKNLNRRYYLRHLAQVRFFGLSGMQVLARTLYLYGFFHMSVFYPSSINPSIYLLVYRCHLYSCFFDIFIFK